MKKVRKDIRKFVGAGIGLGAGTMAVAGAEARGVGTSVLPAFATMGRMMRPIAIGVMGKHTLRMLGKYTKKLRR